MKDKMMMNGEELFNEQAGLHLLKKARWRNRITMVLTSLLVCIVLLFLFYVGNQKLAFHMGQKYLNEENTYVSLLLPNTSIGVSDIAQGFLSGKVSYSTYRMVGSRPVYTGNYEREYSLIPFYFLSYLNYQNPTNTSRITIDQGMAGGSNSSSGTISGTSSGTQSGTTSDPENSGESSAKEAKVAGTASQAPAFNRQTYNYLGQKEPCFYHPGLNYAGYPQELDELNELSSNQLAEIGLSFDRGYTMEEIAELIPEGVNLNWVWMDLYSQEDLKTLSHVPGNSKASLRMQMPFDTRGVHGLNINSGAAQSQVDRAENMRHQAMTLLAVANASVNPDSPYYEASGCHRNAFRIIYYHLREGEKNATDKKIRLIGAIVSGDPATLSQLQGLPFIKASSLGLIVDRY